MDFFTQLVTWPENCNIAISGDQLKIKHNCYGEFVIIYHIKNAYIYISSSDDINSTHLFRICKIKDKYFTDDMFDLMTEISNKIQEPFKYCTVCGNYNNMIINEPSYCTDICKNNIYTLWTNNIVKDCYEHDKLVFKLILETTKHGIKSVRKHLVFNPLPPMYNEISELEQLIISDHFEKNNENIYDIIKHSKNDNDIIKKMSDKIYGLLKFIILSNNFRLKSVNMTDKDIFTKEIDYEKDMVCYEIIHDMVKTELFNAREPEYLYHGSNIGNWYSIMRNGLKNCSGTSLMSAGAAYGNGIYLSDNANISNVYSSGHIDSNIRILGIAQVLNKDIYKKAEGIFVVPDENKVLLKYLITLPGKNKTSFTNIVNFIKNRENEIKLSNVSMINLLIKRLTRELHIIEKKNGNNINIQIEQSNDKIIWKISIKKNNLNLGLLFIFGLSFPVDPPILMIQSPIIDVEPNNNIYNNGVIYIEEIAPKNWNTKTRIYKIYQKIIQIIDKLNICEVKNIEYKFMDVLGDYDNLLKKNNKY